MKEKLVVNSCARLKQKLPVTSIDKLKTEIDPLSGKLSLQIN